MADVPVPEFPPILATNPTVTPAVPAATYDQWFLGALTIDSRGNNVYDLEAQWEQGNLLQLSGKRTNYIVRDLLSQESLIANPEIAEIAPQFMAALAAVGKRLGVL